MKFYHMYANSDRYYDENGVERIVSLRQGEVSVEEFQEYCEIFKKVDFSVIGIDRIENDTLYFYSDIV